MGPDHSATFESRANLASAYLQSGNAPKAEPMLRAVLEYHEKKAGTDRQSLSGSLANLGTCLLNQGKCAEAESVLERCLVIRKKNQPDDWSTFNAMSLLGGSLLGQKKFAAAESLVTEAYAGIKQREALVPAHNKPLVTEAAARIVALYEAWNKPAEAAAWRAKLNPSPARLPADVFGPQR